MFVRQLSSCVDIQLELVRGHPAELAVRTVSMRDIIEEKQRLRESEEQLRQLAARVQTAREEERANLARELHDELGQTLTAIKLELGRTASALRNERVDGQTVDRVQSLIGLVEIGIATVKRIAANLRPATLDHLGLAEAMRWEATTFRASTGHPLPRAGGPRSDRAQRRAADGAVPDLPGSVDQRRAARAAPAPCTSPSRSGDGTFELRIRDNGRGIKDARHADPGAIGLLGMQERAALIGGTFKISGQRGKGHRAITVPCSDVNRRRQADDSDSAG